MVRDDFTSTVDAAAAFEALHHDEPERDRPTLAELLRDEQSPDSFAPDYGPTDHTCVDLPGVGCHVCAREAS